MDDKEARNAERRQITIDKAEKYRRLLSNPDFLDLWEELKGKRRQYDNILHKPKPIGMIETKTLQYPGAFKVEVLKYSQEEDTARIKEAQIRYDTFTRIIDMPEDFVRHAEKIKAEEEKKKQDKQAKKDKQDK